MIYRNCPISTIDEFQIQFIVIWYFLSERGWGPRGVLSPAEDRHVKPIVRRLFFKSQDVVSLIYANNPRDTPFISLLISLWSLAGNGITIVIQPIIMSEEI